MARKTTGKVAVERFPDSDRMRLRVNPALSGKEDDTVLALALAC